MPRAPLFAPAHPRRVTGIVTIAPALPIAPADPPGTRRHSSDDVLDTIEGWVMENRHY
jgi:hypothetical protein